MQLYWDFQMLNAGRLYLLACPYVAETQPTLSETQPSVFCPYLDSQGQGHAEQGIQVLLPPETQGIWGISV